MNDLERNYYNAFVGVRNFGADNAADFKDGTAGARNFAVCVRNRSKSQTV